MALALPYPDMDFVPLDILLASELNQMVANIEFLASGDVGLLKVLSFSGTTVSSGSVFAIDIPTTTIRPSTQFLIACQPTTRLGSSNFSLRIWNDIGSDRFRILPVNANGEPISGTATFQVVYADKSLI